MQTTILRLKESANNDLATHLALKLNKTKEKVSPIKKQKTKGLNIKHGITTLAVYFMDKWNTVNVVIGKYDKIGNTIF